MTTPPESTDRQLGLTIAGWLGIVYAAILLGVALLFVVTFEVRGAMGFRSSSGEAQSVLWGSLLYAALATPLLVGGILVVTRRTAVPLLVSLCLVLAIGTFGAVFSVLNQKPPLDILVGLILMVLAILPLMTILKSGYLQRMKSLNTLSDRHLILLFGVAGIAIVARRQRERAANGIAGPTPLP